MTNFIELISQPWPWYVAGAVIAVVMATLMILGNRFGISSNLRTVCSVLGAGKHCAFFDFNWRGQLWNLIFVVGMLLGGAISQIWLTGDVAAHISEETTNELMSYGIANPGVALVPEEYFQWDALLSIKGFLMLVVGGFLVGFGTRYAGGCTSGHAISGLSNLQMPSLIAVIGFFIGGLTVTYLILPFILPL